VNSLKRPPLKKLAGLVALCCSGGIVVVAAQRILTHTDQDAHLKELFPKAVAFSPLAGSPLHYTAYGADPRQNPAASPVGFAFWTTDLVPQEQGYHGAIHILVGIDLSGVLTGAIVDYDSEPYGYFSVEPPEFGAQFKGKSIRDPFRVGADVDAVSRASISINSAARAIRDSSRKVANLLLPPGVVK
jgi:transcriptional regulator of nitric oxide reductase